MSIKPKYSNPLFYSDAAMKYLLSQGDRFVMIYAGAEFSSITHIAGPASLRPKYITDRKRQKPLYRIAVRVKKL